MAVTEIEGQTRIVILECGCENECECNLEPAPPPKPEVRCYWSGCRANTCNKGECSCTCHKTWRFIHGTKRLS